MLSLSTTRLMQSFPSARWAPALALAALSAPACAAGTLLLTVPPVYGLTFVNDDLRTAQGSLIQEMQRIMRRAHIDVQFELVPWARVTRQVLANPYSCALGMRQTTDNKNLFKWAGPIMQSKVFVYGLLPPSEGASDFSGKRVGIVRGAVYKALLMQHGFHVDEAVDLDANLRKLMARRVDFIAASEIMVAAYARESGPLPLRPQVHITDSPGYVSCNRQIDDQLLQRIEDAIAVSRRNGTLRQFGL